MSLHRLLRALALALTASLLAAASAQAQTFLPPRTIGDAGPGGGIGGVQAASDGAGNSVLVYSRSTCADPECYLTEYRTFYVLGTAGGSFSAPVEFADVGAYEVAMNSAGAAVIAWADADGVRAMVKPAGGRFGAAATLAPERAYGVHVAIGDDGTAVATWQQSTVLRTASKPAGSGAFGSASTVSTTDEGLRESAVAVDRQGNTTVAWLNRDYVVRARTKPVAGAFGGRQSLTSAALMASNVKLGVSSDRRATILWTRYPEPGTSYNSYIEAAESDGTGTFGGPERVSAPGTTTVWGELAVDPSNRAVAVWVDTPGFVAHAATRSATGGFGDPERISNGKANLPLVDIDRHGNALAHWTANASGASSVIEAARRPAGGSFGEPETLTAPGETGWTSRAAFDADGNGLIAFGGRSEGSPAVRVIGLDVTGPRLERLAVPAAATVAEPARFSVDAVDRWSGATTTWDFGDGGRATGAAATHTYAEPGAYAVTVVSEDALGQRTSATRIVNVRARPAPPAAGGGTAGGGSGRPAGSSGTSGTGGGELSVIASTVVHGWLAYPRYTIARKLAVTNLPAGATVTVTCKAKQRGRQRRCPRRARITATFPRARLDLVKPFRRKKLAIGTKLTIEIAAPGRIGKVVTLTMRKRALPRTRTLCRPPGGRAGACA